MRYALHAALVSTLCLPACGEGDGQAPRADGGAHDSDVDGAAPADRCNNDEDRPALQAMYGERTLQDISAGCGIDCISTPPAEQADCVTECVHRESGMAISLLCSSCVTITVGCSRDHCFESCAPIGGGNPNSEQCRDCQCGNNAMGVSCRAMLSECGGVDGERGCPAAP